MKKKHHEEMTTKVPVIDLGRCTKCEGCTAVAPDVFRINTPLGYVEVVERSSYPIDKVNEAIKYCPADCIRWDDQ